MPRRIVIILGHPDPAPARLCRALAHAYRQGAEAAGHEVTLVDLATLDFPLLRTQEDFQHGTLPPALDPARTAILAAQHLVFIFPLWLGTMPALVKSFLEHIMRPGVAFAHQAHGFPKQLLSGRSARLVVTMGMPALAYRWWFFGHGLKGLERSILRFAGIKPVRQTLIGMIGVLGDAGVQRWLTRMREMGAKGT